MRALALAALVGMGLGLAGAAAADPYTDPNGNLSLNAPAGWRVRPEQMQGSGAVVLAFTPSSDCYFFGIPNPASANSSVNAARHTVAPLSPEAWAQASQGVPDLFEGGPPSVVSQSVDTSGFWPVQRAELRSGSRTIHAVLQVRPGAELRGFCSGPDASYDAILNTLGHPNDQQWQAQAAAEPAPQASADQSQGEQTPQPQRRQRRERGITRGDPNSAAGGASPM
jgi:hypothetical protein